MQPDSHQDRTWTTAVPGTTHAEWISRCEHFDKLSLWGQDVIAFMDRGDFKQIDQRHVWDAVAQSSLPSVLRVTGMSVDGDETPRKADSGQTLLKIESVNGKQLANPVYFTFRRAADGIEKPKAGKPFDYFVHEWGSFDGVIDPPEELGIEEPIVAHDGFHYRPEITIHKSNAVQRGAKRQRK